MTERKKNIICNIFLTVSITLLAYVFITIFYLYCFNRLEVKEYERVSLDIPAMEYTLTKDEAKKLIKDIYRTPHFYKEVGKFPDRRDAESVVFIRLVKVEKDLSLENYVMAYAHELTHLKFMYGDETMTVFKTFVMLYESGNAELQHIALKDAQDIINGGYKGTDYDCSYYIIEYLKEKGGI